MAVKNDATEIINALCKGGKGQTFQTRVHDIV